MKEIKKAIEHLNPFKKGTYEYEAFKSELLHLLSLVAEDAFIDGRSVYIERTPISADKIRITAEHQVFEDYWKHFTESLKP